MAGELMNDGIYIYINVPYAEMYIPESIIDTPDGDPKESSVAYECGTGFVTLGICYMRFFKNENQSRDEAPVRTLIYPNLIETRPSDSSKGINLTINGKTDKYRILKYEHGDVLMEATSRKSSKNCEAFMRLLSSGKIPNSLTYDEVYQAWMDNYDINGMSPSAPAVMLQAIIGEMYRDPKDPSRQFSKVIGANPKADPRSYHAMSMNAVSAYSSVMSALSFERMTEKLTSSINMTKSGVKQKKSPIEQIITM